jgi:putative FmdB family regulatory protein
MPTYEYICEKCDHKFEFSQSIKDEALTVCPQEKCGMKKWGKGKIRRAIGAGAGLIFKGSGFYITDYRSENYKQAAKKEAGGGESKSGGTSGGESKSSPATPAPAKSESKTPKSDKS